MFRKIASLIGILSCCALVGCNTISESEPIVFDPLPESSSSTAATSSQYSCEDDPWAQARRNAAIHPVVQSDPRTLFDPCLNQIGHAGHSDEWFSEEIQTANTDPPSTRITYV